MSSSSKLNVKDKLVLTTHPPVSRLNPVSLRKCLALPLLAAFALMASASFSQTDRSSAPIGRAATPAASATAKSDATSPKKLPESKSGWSKLTPQQKTALQPLARGWDSLSAGQQRKWREVSRNYPSLSDLDKANMHSRMAEWGALSTRERAEARLNFATTTELAHELTSQEKKAKWQAYQSLSTEQKKKLANQASRPPAGAATATRPVAAQKLVTLPAPTNSTNKPPKISADSTGNDSATAVDP
ncbi:MAG: hypothetical protein ACI9LD_001460 [Polaromonas sp.]